MDSNIHPNERQYMDDTTGRRAHVAGQSEDSGPRDRLGFLVYRAGLAIGRGYERALEPIDVAPTEAGLLMALAYSGPNHVRGLARLLGIGRQTVTNVARMLERREWISRVTSDSDARLTLFHIAPLGQRQLIRIEELSTAFDVWLREVVGAAHEALLIERLKAIVDAPLLAHEE
jgi:DNA-binding MarR family transcriptional regulator